MSLPKLVEKLRVKSDWDNDDKGNVLEALAIAVEALEYIRKNGTQEKPKFMTVNAQVSDKALRQIEAMGK